MLSDSVYQANPFLSQLLARNPNVRNVLDPILEQYIGTPRPALDDYIPPPQEDWAIEMGRSFGMYGDPGKFAALQSQIDQLGDPVLSQMWQQQTATNQRQYEENRRTPTNWGMLLGAVAAPWLAGAMAGTLGSGMAAGGAEIGAGGVVNAASSGAGLGLGAGEGVVGWDALGNAASGGTGQVGSLAGEAGWGVTQGAGEAMDVWGDPSMYWLDSGYSMGPDAWSFGPGSFADDAWMYGPGNIGDVGVTGWNNDMASLLGTGSTSWTDYLKNGSSILKALGGGSSGSSGGLLGGLLGGSGGSGGLGSLLGLAPILGGLAYGYNMAEPDLGRLEGLYDQYNPQASLGLYDYNTEMGRNQLMSNLGRRGISGSSFANSDITNYNTVRDMGRGSTLNQGVSTAANIASKIAALEAVGNKNKTDLIGRGLYSIGTLFGGK